MGVAELIDKLKQRRFRCRVRRVGHRLWDDSRWLGVQCAQAAGSLTEKNERLFDWFYRNGIRLHRLEVGGSAFRRTAHNWDLLWQALYEPRVDRTVADA